MSFTKRKLSLGTTCLKHKNLNVQTQECSVGHEHPRWYHLKRCHEHLKNHSPAFFHAEGCWKDYLALRPNKRCWNHRDLRGSPVPCSNLRPISFPTCAVDSSQTPVVWKGYHFKLELPRESHILTALTQKCIVAAEPADTVDLLKWVSACVHTNKNSTHILSVHGRKYCDTIRILAFPSFYACRFQHWWKPSYLIWSPNDVNERWVSGKESATFPTWRCAESQLIRGPQRQGSGLQVPAPTLRTTTIRCASRSIWVPKYDTGTACFLKVTLCRRQAEDVLAQSNLREPD